MRVITHCPSCQTQFFATEEQLNKHGGKVRCGQCMHVFDARAQLVAVTEQAESTTDNTSTPDNSAEPTTAFTADFGTLQSTNTDTLSQPDQTAIADTYTEPPQPSYLGDTGKKFKAHTSTGSSTSRRWLWGLASLILLLIAALQSIYFLRNEIAIYYPNAKPYLLQACEKIQCSIDLPRKIDFIVIDDSDMQEDSEHPGLVRFASTLINQGHHVVAYPNLELTLTDIEDAPVIRRVFKPHEYLPAGTPIEEGIAAGAETRIKLAITTKDIPVSGYRVFVTY